MSTHDFYQQVTVMSLAYLNIFLNIIHNLDLLKKPRKNIKYSPKGTLVRLSFCSSCAKKENPVASCLHKLQINAGGHPAKSGPI